MPAAELMLSNRNGLMTRLKTKLRTHSPEGKGNVCTAIVLSKDMPNVLAL